MQLVLDFGISDCGHPGTMFLNRDRNSKARCAIMSNRHSAYCVIPVACDKETMQRPSNTTRKALGTMTRIMCVFALLLVSFAHRVAAPPPQADIDLSAYTLPDGTVPVICHSPSGTDDGGGSTVLSGDCEYCRLAGAAILPPPVHAWSPSGAPGSPPVCMAPDPVVSPVHYAGTPTRGPPLT